MGGIAPAAASVVEWQRRVRWRRANSRAKPKGGVRLDWSSVVARWRRPRAVPSSKAAATRFPIVLSSPAPLASAVSRTWRWPCGDRKSSNGMSLCLEYGWRESRAITTCGYTKVLFRERDHAARPHAQESVSDGSIPCPRGAGLETSRGQPSLPGARLLEKALEETRLARPLAKQVGPIGLEVRPVVDDAAGPADLDALHTSALAQ